MLHGQEQGEGSGAGRTPARCWAFNRDFYILFIQVLFLVTFIFSYVVGSVAIINVIFSYISFSYHLPILYSNCKKKSS